MCITIYTYILSICVSAQHTDVNILLLIYIILDYYSSAGARINLYPVIYLYI